MALQRESERIAVSPDLRRRLDARMGRGSGMRARVLAVCVAVVLVAVGIAVWLVAGRGPVKKSLIGTPAPAADEYFAGYWPVSTRADAEAVQRRVDGGQETWRRDPAAVAKAYGESLGWIVSDEVGSTSSESASTRLIDIAPMVGEGSNLQRGAEHWVRLVSLDGAERPAWFVAGITSDNITVDEPRPGATIASPVRVAGTGLAFEGNILVSVVDRPVSSIEPHRESSLSGQQPVQAGGSEPAPFEASIAFQTPTTNAGIVAFEGGNGIGGPSTDVTVVRVRFAKASSDDASPQPSQQALDEDAAADDAFRCFINARHVRDLEAGKECMTQRYADSLSDPVEFIGPSSPSVERATIISSARDGDQIVYDAFVYWGSSTGLQFVSEDTIIVVVEGGRALVDDWTQGSQTPIGQTKSVTLRFLALGDTPKCAGESATEDSFVSVERVVPAEAVIDDQALSVTRELVTGHWAHEREAQSVFPNGIRVERVSVANGVATVEVNRVPHYDTSCDHVVEALRQTLTGLDGITDVELREAAPQTPSGPDI